MTARTHGPGGSDTPRGAISDGVGRLRASLGADAPPTDVAPAVAALWWLKKGGLAPGTEWERAHAICQTHEGEAAYDLVHALAHWIEGDVGNADYWYRRAGYRRGPADLAAEWDRIAARLAEG